MKKLYIFSFILGAIFLLHGHKAHAYAAYVNGYQYSGYNYPNYTTGYGYNAPSSGQNYPAYRDRDEQYRYPDYRPTHYFNYAPGDFTYFRNYTYARPVAYVTGYNYSPYWYTY
jgi:hypothetical protein